jgi:hypothetical protein
MGVLALKLWHLLVMVAPRRDGQPPPEDSWQAHFEALQNDGLRNLNFTRTMHGILLPVMTQLATALAVPYVITRGALPWLGLPAHVLQYANLYGHQVYHGLYVLYLGLRKMRKAAVELHNAIRDDRYLVGKELNNFDGEAAAAAAAAEAAAAAAAADTGVAEATGGAGQGIEPAARLAGTDEAAAGGCPRAGGEAGKGEMAAVTADAAAVGESGIASEQQPAHMGNKGEFLCGVEAQEQQQQLSGEAGTSCDAGYEGSVGDRDGQKCSVTGGEVGQGTAANALVHRHKPAAEIEPAW